VVTFAVSNWKKRGLLVFADDPEQAGKQASEQASKRMIGATKLDLSIKGTTMVMRWRRERSGDVRRLCPDGFGSERRPSFAG